jgi:hypothetical protein
MFYFCLIQVYYSEDILSVPVVMIQGKCEVTTKDNLHNSNLPVVVEHSFYCEYLYDPHTGALKQVKYCLNSVFYLPSYTSAFILSRNLFT